MDIAFPDPSSVIVATVGLLLVYIIAPLLSLVGRVKIANDSSPTFLLVATANVDDANVDVSNDTVNVLLVFVDPPNSAVAACVAVNVTVPAPTIVIAFPNPSSVIVATSGLLLIYVIAPLLLLVGAVVIANAVSATVFVEGTTNVDDANVDDANGDVPAKHPSPCISNVVAFIVNVVTLVSKYGDVVNVYK